MKTIKQSSQLQQIPNDQEKLQLSQQIQEQNQHDLIHLVEMIASTTGITPAGVEPEEAPEAERRPVRAGAR